jgi:hypothetical protein
MREWAKGSFFDNVDVFASSFGYDNAGIALMLAMVPWESTNDRDSFITAVTGNFPPPRRPQIPRSR